MKVPLSRRDFIRSASLLGAAPLWAACRSQPPGLEAQQRGSLRYLKILSTNDEHGWLEQGDGYGGANSLMYKWIHDEKIMQNPDRLLILSSGDLYTGPALSTWFKGESTIDIMNAMGYAAAAIGNHDFDYGLDNLQGRAAQASFPLLSANIRQKSDGAVPNFIQPYVIKAVSEVKVGLVGLTTRETPVDTKPAHVAAFDFLHYETALNEVVPYLRQAGADLVLVLGHICTSEMRTLASAARLLDIPLIFGGHCHELADETVDGVRLVQSGAFMRGYTRVELLFDLSTRKVLSLEVSFHENKPGQVDQSLSERIAGWRARSDPALWEKIGYARQKISRSSAAMAQLLGNAWLAAVPGAQVALAEQRYIQSLPAGEITPASIVGMLAPDDVLIDVALTGAALVEIIEGHRPLVFGLTETDGNYFLAGQLLDPQAAYHVLVPDDIYAGCQGYPFMQVALTAQDTGIGWREPVIKWIAAQKTSWLKPLDDFLSGS
jgi:2',3'-cyclic-nucleotide 2'-phosphodiesterase (5'-nucleotidase family)